METSNKIATITGVTVGSEKHVRKKRFWHINKDMLPYKLHYFLFVGGLGAVLPYLPAIGITRLGLTAGNLAGAYTCQQFVTILSNPGIGYLADYFNKLKAFIIGLSIIQALLFFVLIIVPSTDEKSISKSNSSVNESPICNLCNMYEDFRSKLHNIPASEFKKMLSCYEERNNSDIKCSNLDNFDSISVNIFNRTCDIPVVQEIVTTIFPDSYPASTNNILFTVSFFNGSENLRRICFTPEHISVLKSGTSHDIIQKYCRSISDTVILKNLQQFNITKNKILTCGNSFEHLFVQDKLSPATTSDNFQTYRFWLFTICIIATTICEVSLFTISDTACYESTKGVDFGRQRCWGAIGWGLMASFSGFLIDNTQGYFVSWFLLVFFYCLQIWNLSRMNLVKPNLSDNILKDVKSVFKSIEFLAFEVGVLLNGMFTGVIWFYMSWFLIQIGGNKLHIGLLQAAQCYLGEVPMMIISSWMIRKFGHFNMVSSALLCHGIRFFIYSYIHNPWWVIPVECLHGITYGSFVPAMTSYGKLNAKPGTETTTQAVLNITFDSVGAGIGCIVAGIFFDLYGAHTTFFFASFTCMLASFINVVFTVLFRFRKKDLDSTELDADIKSY